MRLENTLKFIDEIEKPVLCIGDKSPFDMELCNRLKIKYKHTKGNLNFDDVYPEKTIFCFDTIEYLMNPLKFLINCTPCKIIYISYQYNPITYFWSNTHFVEYPKRSFEKLVQESGYKIEKCNRIWFERINFKGIRPILRTLINSRYYYKLRLT